MEKAASRLEILAARHPDRPWLKLARAYVEEERDPRHAAEKYRVAVSAFVARGHTEGEVRARCVFALWLSRRGENRAAGQQLAAAVRRAEAVGPPELLAEALIFQARRLRALGADLQEAYRLAQQAERALFPSGPVVQQMLCLELVANLERELGRPDRAASHYRQLERLAQTSGRSNFKSRAHLGLSLLLFDDLDRAPRESAKGRAVSQLRQALTMAEEAGDPQTQAWIHSILGHLLRPPEALEHLERCLALSRGRNDYVTASCLLSRACARAETDPAVAQRSLEEAHAVTLRAGDLGSLARFWYGRMSFSWRFRPREQAISDSLKAIKAVEALRDRQMEQAGRAGLFSRWLAPYYAASGHLLAAFQRSGDPADLDQAFAITEAMRARVLRDLLADRRSADPPASRRAIETALGPDVALISFQIAPRQDFFGFAGGSWLLVSTHGGTRAYLLPETVDRAGLETAVPALLGLIDRRDGSEADLSAALYQQLFGRALGDLPSGVSRLMIVPDGILHLLPFAILRPRSRDAPLTHRYQISLTPSANLWARWRRQARRATRAALVLADPVLPAALQETVASGETGRLPRARREGRRAANRCGAGSLVRTGFEAGEAFLKRQDLSRFGVLHLAAHAIADEASPEASAVLLAADASGEDGRLQVDEIARLNLTGGLVALSSCRSASGALVGGEGVMSLTRAFFAAGSAVVVGSLWPMRDDDAEAFFAVFYDHLAAGETAAAAFSAAQRERLRDGAPAEAWAGFVLSGNGDWRLPPAPKSDSRLAGLLVGAGLLALAVGYVVRRRLAR